MFIRTVDQPEGIRQAWERLESLLGSLRGRKFFGTFDLASSEYRACVQLRDDDDPAALGLEVGTIPGGSYLRARIHGEPPQVYEQISPTFDELVKLAPPDDSRPSIEFYRRRDEIDLLMPLIDS
jgi:hypothetical protein